jgi:hypothetical protein
MEEFIYKKIRTKPRFNVNLKARYFIIGNGMQHQECRITNLSSSDATVRFPRTASLKSGDIIGVDIAIPNTIIHIPAKAEIMGTKQHTHELMSYIKFMTTLSDDMILPLVKKIPDASLNF